MEALASYLHFVRVLCGLIGHAAGCLPGWNRGSNTMYRQMKRRRTQNGWHLRPELLRVSVFFMWLHDPRTRTLSPVEYDTGTDC